jgi:hypothetical protein
VPINVFDFTVSRHRDGPDEFLQNYTGPLMADCWSGFQKIELRSDSRITIPAKNIPTHPAGSPQILTKSAAPKN